MKKKPKEKKPRWELQAAELVAQTGMSPYNAALKLGRKHAEAELFAGLEVYKHLTGLTYRDIAEQEGATPRVVIRHLIERSGIMDREQGAKKIVGTEDNFVEAPDDRIQLAYLRELNQICEFTKKDNEHDPNAAINRPFDIHISVYGEGEKEYSPEVKLSIRGKEVDNSEK